MLLKTGFQGVLRPLAHGLARAGVTPNALTAATMLYCVGLGALLSAHPTRALLLATPLCFLARIVLNTLDGMLAREHDGQTPAGVLLNELSELVCDAGLFLPFALLPGARPSLVVLVFLLGTAADVVGLAAVQLGDRRRTDGPFAKPDRTLGFAILGVLLGAGLRSARWLDAYLALLALLAVVTVARRFRRALATSRA